MKMPNIAVIGAGDWGKNLVRNFAELNVLHTVCDTDVGKLETLCTRWPHVNVSTVLTAVLQNPEIEAVAIATPVTLHYPLAKAALNAGKDVFVEKPLALTVAEGEELRALSQRLNRILMVGHLLEYHPAVLRLKKLVNDGVLGKVQYIYSNRLNLGKIRKEENILWSFAPHDLSVILLLLNEMPLRVGCHGASYLHQSIADVTISTLEFPSGVQAHIFVSWLHPYKEQKLVVVGDKQMACFDDTVPEGKLKLFSHHIQWIERVPVIQKAQAEVIETADVEPLREECEHFVACVAGRILPRTDAASGVRVLRILQACQQSLEEGGAVVSLPTSSSSLSTLGHANLPYYAHPTSTVDEPCTIGIGTRIWHYSHIMPEACIGEDCTLGQNVLVASNVRIGNRVKIQNNVSIYTGVTLEDEVFCGPSMVFTNVINPRSAIPRREAFRQTIVCQGATLGANATIICGVTIGRYAFVGAGAVVTKDVPDYALILGNPGRLCGWMCECGVRLHFTVGEAICQDCDRSYCLRDGRVIRIETSQEAATWSVKIDV
jgi:UDP-2-acetamido-3-amino-2,3-dideoxy-glucuronate N-acetyltransferase